MARIKAPDSAKTPRKYFLLKLWCLPIVSIAPRSEPGVHVALEIALFTSRPGGTWIPHASRALNTSSARAVSLHKSASASIGTGPSVVSLPDRHPPSPPNAPEASSSFSVLTVVRHRNAFEDGTPELHQHLCCRVAAVHATVDRHILDARNCALTLPLHTL